MKPRKEHYRRKLPHYQPPGQWYSVTFTLAGAIPKAAMNKYSIQLETARNRMEELRFMESDNPLSNKPESDFPKSDNLQFGKLKSFSATSESRSPDLRIGNPQSRFADAKKEYRIALRKYHLAYDNILNKSTSAGVNLIKTENRIIIEEALQFWEGKRLTNHAWCIMSNHVHWIFTVFEKEVVVGIPGVGVSNADLSNTNSNFGKSESLEKQVYLQDILHSVKLYTARRINENENRIGQLWEHESFDTTIRNDSHFVNVFNYVIHNPVSAGLAKKWREWPGTRVFGDEKYLHP